MNIKKILASSVISAIVLGINIAFPLSALATTWPTVTLVGGQVTDKITHATINGAVVTLTCNGITKTSLPTDVGGVYNVVFESGCNTGNLVTATATTGDGKVGTGEGVALPVDILNINLAVANVQVASVPEFGVIPGAMALITSAGSFLLFKKRKV